MTDDRRQDTPTRSRYDELDSSIRRWQREVDRRYRRVTWILTIISVMGALASGIGFALIQGQRYDAILANCRSRNEQSEAFIGLLSDLHARHVVVDAAHRRFPTNPTCRDAATRQIGWFRL